MGDKIEITKENYKEYTELFEQLRFWPITKKFEKRVIITYLLSWLSVFPLSLIIPGGKIGILISVLLPLTTGSSYIVRYYKNTENKIKTELKNKYPDKNINVNIGLYELQNELKEVGIITSEIENGVSVSVIDPKKFEEKIKQEEFIEKCEKIKQDTFKKNKSNYTNSTLEPYISEQELTNVKEQVKTLVKKK